MSAYRFIPKSLIRVKVFGCSLHPGELPTETYVKCKVILHYRLFVCQLIRIDWRYFRVILISLLVLMKFERSKRVFCNVVLISIIETRHVRLYTNNKVKHISSSCSSMFLRIVIINTVNLRVLSCFPFFNSNLVFTISSATLQIKDVDRTHLIHKLNETLLLTCILMISFQYRVRLCDPKFI